MASVASSIDTVSGSAVRPRRYMDRKSLVPLLLFLPPALLLFTVFVVLPMIDAGTFSFFDWTGYGPITDFVGFDNYEDVITHRNFGTAVRNSLIVVAVSLLIQLPLAMWAAIALSERGTHVNILRTIFFVPYMLAEIAAGLIWKFVYDGNYGLVPIIGDAIGQKLPFVLADKLWVIPAIMLVIIWKYFGFHMMIYIAGLQSIPSEVIEAARLDGVKKWKIVWHIKLPMIWSAIVVSVFFSITGALQLFDLIIPLTGGGPQNTSHTIVTFLYQFGILRMKLGFGGAVSVMLFIACVIVAIVYRRLLFRAEQT
ncbi:MULTISPECIES: sugar ABC transporter permease [unclassified Devosia]|jgi:raffinose/stachyose/melibiose transport system permease protein|uniref:carbohydrate ABC transporter permease n=1 Tax=unclassified Devosia TaxID=196773 RepID=UPI00092C57B4|nr:MULTISPECIES: sugar ABC transporter permease [unclassified Devosia]OJX51419.1 MAG: sugar ABC transporter permease [Devosia sp. 66-22]